MSEKDLSSALTHAIYYNNTDRIANLLAEPPSPQVLDQVNERGETRLHSVLLHSYYPKIPRLLADAGAHIDPEYEAEHANELRLWTAVLRGDLDELRRRIDAGDSVDQAPQGGKARGWTALWLAVKLGREDAARMLIQAGADVNTIDKDGNTLIFQAFSNIHLGLAKLLIDAGANVDAVDQNNNTPLHGALNHLNRDLAKLLVEANANVNAVGKFGLTPLHIALRYTNFDMVRVLIDAGADVNAADDYGSTPLHEASSGNFLYLVKVLVEAGANAQLLDQDGNSALFGLLSSDNFHFTSTPIRETFTLLTDAGATVDGATAKISPLVPSDVIRVIVPEDTPFWLAANNDAPMLAIELAGGLDPNMKTENGMTLLHWACAGDAPECVQLLLDAGAEPNIRLLPNNTNVEEDDIEYEYEDDFEENVDNELLLGPQPIFYCMHESSACLECLIHCGADVNSMYQTTVNHVIKLPIYFALAANSPACVTALVGAGAWVTKKEMRRFRLTHLLVVAFEIRPVPVDAQLALLAAAGERVLFDEIGEMTPLYWAVVHSTVDVVRALVEAGVDMKKKFRSIVNGTFNGLLEFAEYQLRITPSHASRLTAIIDYLKSLPCFSEEQ